jgi:uncharacterized membrane protein
MEQRKETASATARNIETTVKIEEEQEHRISHGDRISDIIGTFAGTTYFVLLQLAFLTSWIGINLGAFPSIPAFDSYPFSLLSVVLSFEGVLLISFVLVSESRASRRADLRSQLDLQINLLSEKEITKVLQVLLAISRHLGIEEQAVDSEIRELSDDTTVEDIARDLRANEKLS